MKKISIDKAARIANGKSRACAKCPFCLNKALGVCEVCGQAFIEGFKKGVKYAKDNNR